MSIEGKPGAKWLSERRMLNNMLAKASITPVELARRAGIDYYSAWRFLRFGITNRTKNSTKVWEYFCSIGVTEQRHLDKRVNDALQEACNDSPETDLSRLIRTIAEMLCRRQL